MVIQSVCNTNITHPNTVATKRCRTATSGCDSCRISNVSIWMILRILRFDNIFY